MEHAKVFDSVVVRVRGPDKGEDVLGCLLLCNLLLIHLVQHDLQLAQTNLQTSSVLLDMSDCCVLEHLEYLSSVLLYQGGALEEGEGGLVGGGIGQGEGDADQKAGMTSVVDPSNDTVKVFLDGVSI